MFTCTVLFMYMYCTCVGVMALTLTGNGKCLVNFWTDQKFRVITYMYYSNCMYAFLLKLRTSIERSKVMGTPYESVSYIYRAMLEHVRTHVTCTCNCSWGDEFRQPILKWQPRSFGQWDRHHSGMITLHILFKINSHKLWDQWYTYDITPQHTCIIATSS